MNQPMTPPDPPPIPATWNPVTGCTKISPGCRQCHAEPALNAMRATGAVKYRSGFRLAFHEAALAVPAAWRERRFVAVSGLGDLFHKQVPNEFIRRVFSVMAAAPRHVFLVLTRRPRRVRELADTLEWSPNVWLGVSIESAEFATRLDLLRACPAAVRVAWWEPLIDDPGEVVLDDVDWVVCGGECGPGARPMKAAWARALRDRAERAGVPFCFKQWSGADPREAGRLLDGRRHTAAPAPLDDCTDMLRLAGFNRE